MNSKTTTTTNSNQKESKNKNHLKNKDSKFSDSENNLNSNQQKEDDVLLDTTDYIVTPSGLDESSSNINVQVQLDNNASSTTTSVDEQVNLLNENEVHYNILICRECPSAKIINPKTRRCITENGAIAKKLRKFY